MAPFLNITSTEVVNTLDRYIVFTPFYGPFSQLLSLFIWNHLRIIVSSKCEILYNCGTRSKKWNPCENSFWYSVKLISHFRVDISSNSFLSSNRYWAVLHTFYTHYRKPGDSFNPCGHLDIVEGYDTETTCPICLEQENGQSWIQCPLCIRWYHEPCYEQ